MFIESQKRKKKGYTFKIWKSYHIDICQPKFGLYSWMDRAKKTINFRLWNFWNSPFQAKDMAIWKLTSICYQYQLLMVIAWIPYLLLTWVPYQGMEQTKLMILGFEILKKVHSSPEISSFEYEHSKLVNILASRGAIDLRFCPYQYHSKLRISWFESFGKLHFRPKLYDLR